jgi:endonuclease YncB( thermonuclease family)
MLRFAFFPALAALAAPAAAQPLVGPTTLVDGDTLKMGDATVRLHGIDAPEAKQTCDREGQTWACGEASTRQLKALVDSGTVICRPLGTDAHGRTVATCNVAAIEINRAMVSAGWATAFRSYSNDYVADEQSAKSARVGIWSSTFQLPQDYRFANAPQAVEPRAPQRIASSARKPSLAAPFGDGRCAIKGNRNRKGQWIYHVPGMPYYEATRAEEIFCSEGAAQAAGYRRAIVR